MANKFRKGDKVTITVGKDKGKSGTITQVFPAEHKKSLLRVLTR